MSTGFTGSFRTTGGGRFQQIGGRIDFTDPANQNQDEYAGRLTNGDRTILMENPDEVLAFQRQ